MIKKIFPTLSVRIFRRKNSVFQFFRVIQENFFFHLKCTYRRSGQPIFIRLASRVGCVGEGVLKAWKNWIRVLFYEFRLATPGFGVRFYIKLFVGIWPPQSINFLAHSTANSCQVKNFDHGMWGKILRETKVFVTNFCTKPTFSEINA